MVGIHSSLTNAMTVHVRFMAIMMLVFFIGWVLKGCPH